MNRILLAASLAMGMASLGQAALAATPEFQITPRAGMGSLRVDALVGVNEDRIHTDTFGLGAGFGYLTRSGIVAEIGGDSFGDIDWFDTFDNFSLRQYFVSVGYQAEFAQHWRLVPKVGRARWKLRSEEGRLLNPGPEETREKRGYDYFWEVGLSRRVSSVVALGVHYKQGQYEFGRTRATTFQVTLAF